MDAQARVSTTKDMIAIVREVAIIGGFAFLLYDPGFLFGRIDAFRQEALRKRMPLTKLSILGAEFSLEEQKDVFAAVIQKTEETAKLVQEKPSAPSATPADVQRKKQIEEQLNSIVAQARTGIAEVKTAQLAQLRQQEEPAQDATSGASGAGVYGIVVSADKQADQASYEVQQLKSKKLADVAVYNRQGFLRTVARFPDNSAAQRNLTALQSYRKTAYAVNLSHWCPSAEATDQVIAGVSVLRCR